MGFYDDDVSHEQHVSKRKYGKPMGPGNPHYPNKNERKLLTAMMQKSGHTEEQVRADINNRRKLAEAAKEPMKPIPGHNRYAVLVRRAKRNIAARLGIPVWDKRVSEELTIRRDGRSDIDMIRVRLGYSIRSFN